MSIDLQMKLSDHFTLGEMIRSGTASRMGIKNIPNAGQIKSLQAWCENIGQPTRNRFGRPVIVTSGFRSEKLNTRIGGSKSSQHCKGEASDFTVARLSNLEVCRWIISYLEFDQLIYEFGESGWIHCSFREGNNRKQVLRAVRKGGKVQYLKGLAD